MHLDLDHAAKAHIDWLGRLMHALQHDRPSAELRRESAGDDCLFGRWLVEHAAAQGYDRAALRRADELHRTMHDLALALLAARHADEEYYATLDRFCRAAVEFNRQVNALNKVEMRASA